jgi:hypothetical protein
MTRELAKSGATFSRPQRGGLVLAMAALVGLAPTAAHGQIGYGWWFGGYQTPSSVQFLNDQALARTRAIAATRSQPQALRAPSRSGRDTTFFERYDPETRRAMEDRVARRPSRASRPAPAAPAPAPADPTPRRHVVALATLFNDQDEVRWPPSAPVEGSLQSLRRASDAASLEVLQETRNRGVAKVASVTEARDRLLDYGRPALALVRSRGDAETEDIFHTFLVALYDSLGAAALGTSATSR